MLKQEKEKALLEEGSGVFSVDPKQRRKQCVPLKKLTQVIGKNIRLYDMVLQFLRTFYLRSRVIHYCSLRNEILMSLHDEEVTQHFSFICYVVIFSSRVDPYVRPISHAHDKSLQ